MDILEEKCICCNGKGKRQIWSDQVNKWTYTENSPICPDCKGKGIRQYYTYIGGTSFLKKKVYIA